MKLSLKNHFVYYCYSLDNKSHGRASMSSDPKVGPESDTDSMAEYGEGDTGELPVFRFLLVLIWVSFY